MGCCCIKHNRDDKNEIDFDRKKYKTNNNSSYIKSVQDHIVVEEESGSKSKRPNNVKF